MEEKKLRDKFPLAFRAPSPPLPSLWQDLDDDELMALEIPGVDPTAPPALHMDQIDMQIAEKLREIDNNMAEIHSILQYTILPGLKDYARSTEPIREVSRFWISMFQAACAPKEPEPEMPNRESRSYSRSVDRISSEELTPQSSSTAHSEMRTPTTDTSEPHSFQVQLADTSGSSIVMGGPNAFTSTPVAHRLNRSQHSNHSVSASGSAHQIEDTDHSTSAPSIQSIRSIQSKSQESEQSLQRNIDKMLESFDISDSTMEVPAIPNASFTSDTSNSYAQPTQKGKAKAAGPDLRTRALHNVALGAMHEAQGSVFKERFRSTSGGKTNTASPADTSLSNVSPEAKVQPQFKPKPPASTGIFQTNPAHTLSNLNSENAAPIFKRMQEQIFAPAPGQTIAAAKQRMLQNLLKEAAVEKRAGLPVEGSPVRSPARFNKIRNTAVPAMGMGMNISISDDDITTSSMDQTQHGRTDTYGNEIIGTGVDMGDSDDDLDWDDDDDEDEDEDNDDAGEENQGGASQEGYSYDNYDNNEDDLSMDDDLTDGTRLQLGGDPGEATDTLFGARHGVQGQPGLALKRLDDIMGLDTGRGMDSFFSPTPAARTTGKRDK